MSEPRRYRVEFVPEQPDRGEHGRKQAYSRGWSPSNYTTFERALVHAGGLFAASAAAPVRVIDRVDNDFQLARISARGVWLHPCVAEGCA